MKILKEEIFKKLILVLMVVLICLTLLEVGLRIKYTRACPESIFDKNFPLEKIENDSVVNLGEIIKQSSFRKIIYELKPNLNVYFINSYVKTNSLGWREEEFSKEKNNDTIRIIGIGDSSMFGWGVNKSDRYMDLLEKELNERFPEYKWEIIVFATPGYNLIIEVEALKQYALDYNPDVIIYGFCDNDMYLPNFIIPKRNFFSKRFMIVDYLKSYIIYVYSGKNIYGDESWSICYIENTPPHYKEFIGKEPFLKSLTELKDIAKDKRISLVVTSINEINDDYKIYGENVYYISTVEEFQKYSKINNSTDLKISEQDKHISRKGHEIFAKVVYNQLVEKGIIKKLIGS